MTGNGRLVAGNALVGKVIDTSSTEEFMVQVSSQASAPELVRIVEALDAKSAGFRRILGDPAHRPPADELRSVLRSIFATRRRADEIVGAVGSERLAEACLELVHVGEMSDTALARFERVLAPVDAVPFELAFELLHFTRPERFWLWTRWIFDPRTETGALRLLTTDDFDLFGVDTGETYLKVGAALAFLDEHARASRAAGLDAGPFTLDVLLACVYAVYMYTVLRLRMTQEFNRIVPALPEMVRRLLGVQHTEV